MEDQTSASIQVAAARSRDERNARTTKGFTDRRRHGRPVPPSNSSSSSQLLLEGQTSSSMQFTVRSRDDSERNAWATRRFTERFLQPSNSSSSSMSVLTDKEEALPAQSIPTPRAIPSVAYRSLLSLNDNKMKDALVEMRNLFAKSEVCAPCYIHGFDHLHKMVNCTNVAIGYEEPKSKYRTWKSQLNLPTGVCFKCCYPQVSVVSWYQCDLRTVFFRLRVSMNTVYVLLLMARTLLGRCYFHYGTEMN